jgi:hypothetical protein
VYDACKPQPATNERLLLETPRASRQTATMDCNAVINYDNSCGRHAMAALRRIGFW